MNNPIQFLNATQADYSAAKRLSEIVNSYAIAYPHEQLGHMWLAIRLSDGSTDGCIYDTRLDAVRHQPDENLCAYMSLMAAPGGMDVREAYTFLQFHRLAYDAGYRLSDPDAKYGGQQLMAPIATEDAKSMIATLLRGVNGGRHYKG